MSICSLDSLVKCCIYGTSSVSSPRMTCEIIYHVCSDVCEMAWIIKFKLVPYLMYSLCPYAKFNFFLNKGSKIVLFHGFLHLFRLTFHGC